MIILIGPSLFAVPELPVRPILPVNFLGEQIIQDKDIQKDSLIEKDAPEFAGQDSAGIASSELTVTAKVIFFRIAGLEEIRLLKFLRSFMKETIIILAQHRDVNIVIPGNESSVPGCTQQGAALKEIRDAELSADPVQFVEHIQFDGPEFFSLTVDMKAQPVLFLEEAFGKNMFCRNHLLFFLRG